ncbi:Ras- protein Rab-7A [Cichlidogyrus casuarinus]|uniref:Ras- protein Rab-7A n=1 Tax=Cichlidogyrus casuarinus TaxID=1844966 RepID=A0ABD2QNR0_9PLAT
MSSKRKMLKMIILGDTGVGKTSLMNQFVNQKFSNQYKATIGADFSTKDVEINNKKVTLQIWDTAGQERFQSLGVAFYRGADCCVLVFDLTQLDSFKNLEQWYNRFIIQANPQNQAKFPFILIGNKSDLEEETVVNKSRIANWCSTMDNMAYFECSAKNALNVREAFLKVAQTAVELDPQITWNNDTCALPSVELSQSQDKQANTSSCC